MPVETLPCGHPEWLDESPPVVFHANKMYAFWKRKKRFPVWNVYSIAISAGLLLGIRLLSFITPFVSDIALAVTLFVGFVYVFADWLKSRSSPISEE